jgi:hypothetical protein
VEQGKGYQEERYGGLWWARMERTGTHDANGQDEHICDERIAAASAAEMGVEGGAPRKASQKSG